MSFLAPVFLYLSALAILPVVFHLIFRQRKRTINVPSLIFFLRTDPKLAAKHNLRKYLILFCRCMIIFFLMTALARPQIVSSGSTKPGSDIVVVIDNTASMARKAELDNNRTCLDVAKDIVSGLVKSSQDEFDLTVLPMVPVSTKVGSELEDIVQTQASYNLNTLLERISSESEKELTVHIFTDLQSNMFNENEPVVSKNIKRIIFHRIYPVQSNDANICIRDIEIIGQSVLPGHPCTVSVKLENNSDFQGSVQVSITDDRGITQSGSVSLAARSVKAQDYVISGLTSGVHPVNIELSGDTFNMDNFGSAVIYCREPVTVVFGGQATDFGLIPVALSPFGDARYSGISNVFRAINRLVDYCNTDKPEMIVLTYSGVAEMERSSAGWLEDYVKSGGNVLVVPYDGQNVLEIPRNMKARPGKLISSQGKELQISANGSEFWYRIFGGNIKNAKDIALYNYYPLTLSSPSVSLLKCDLTETVLAHTTLEKGNIYLSGFVFDNKWTSLPRDPLMVVMLQNFVTMSSDKSRNMPFDIAAVRAGENTASLLDGNIKAVTLTGPNFDFDGDVKDLILPAFASVVLVENNEKQSYISISSDSTEGLFDYPAKAAVKVKAIARAPHYVKDVDSLDGSVGNILATGKVFDLFLPMIILSVSFFVFESLLANMTISGRRVK